MTATPAQPCGHERSRRVRDYEAANRKAAEIIASDPAKYPVDSLPGVWARMVLDRGGAED